MSASSTIRYRVAKLREQTKTPGIAAKIAKLQAELPKAVKRESKAFAKLLASKVVVYLKYGCVYSHEGVWSVSPDDPAFVRFTKPGVVWDFAPKDLSDGRGNSFTLD